MAATESPHAAPPQLRVEQHLRCRNCGYDVFGQSVAGKCPECGAPVALSLHGDMLYNADPRWLKRLGRAATLTAILMTFGALWPMVALVVALLSSERALDLWVIVAMVCTAVWLIGVLAATAKEPAEDHLTREELWLRCLAVCALLLLTAVAPRMFYNRLPFEFFGLWAVLVAAYFLHSRHLSTRMARAQQTRLARSIRDNGIWMVVGHLLLLAGISSEIVLFALLWLLFTSIVIGMAAYQQHEAARELRIAALVARDQRDYLAGNVRQ